MFWRSVLTDLRNRGVKDVFFVVCDGLKGLPAVVGSVWPQAIVQTSSTMPTSGICRRGRWIPCCATV
jgi:transposase-like protein